MSLVWDDTGARYFETGVSKGILFPMTGSGLGVPWNGLVSVTLDPSGGELESYYWDGVKYMDRIQAEEFLATVTTLATPKEFERCEGVYTKGYGMKTHQNMRDKFNMAWRTIIGNDQDPEVGYRIHIAYNCTVQPSTRSYQTLADNATPDVRSFTITTTPACGIHSYFSFSSLEGDLSGLESQLNNGILPRCSDLKGLVLSLDTDGGPVIDPDDGCPSADEDFESYLQGQLIDSEDVTTAHSYKIYGLLNNGLNVQYLPVNGTFTANDSTATVVGSGAILADDDEATYIESAEGDMGFTVGIPALTGYIEGASFELHISVSIDGGVNEDDPDNLDGLRRHSSQPMLLAILRLAGSLTEPTKEWASLLLRSTGPLSTT